jgi:phosphatidylglycerol:prolipoprotein diacylglycerol transferase
MHPIVCKFSFITVYSYGLLLATGFLVAFFLIIQKCKKQKVNSQVITDLCIWLLIGGILGGRLLHVAVNLRYYLNDPKEIIMLQHGGLAYQGGLVLAVICGWIFLRKKEIAFLPLADLLIPYVALAQSIGRVGCFLNGCCYGDITNSIFGMKFPQLAYFVYPTQLYYSLAWLITFIILNQLYEKRHFVGETFCLYFLFYGLIRFLIDFYRGDLSRIWAGLTLTQIISLFFVVLSISFYLWFKKNAKERI